MATGTSGIGHKHHHTTCCDCFGKRREKLDKANPLALTTPPPLNRSNATLTKEVVDFSKLVKVDEFDGLQIKNIDGTNARDSSSEEEIKTVEVVFSRIHGMKEKKNE